MNGISHERRETDLSVMDTLFLLAITGSMGCGKSSVSHRLAKLGAYLLDADQDARAVLTPGSSAWQALLERFGTQILVDQGSPKQSLPLSAVPLAEIDRRALGERVFHDPTARAALEEIIHPRVWKRQARALAQWQKTSPPAPVTIVVAEIPLLFETASEQRFVLTVAVLCGAQQWQRLEARSGMSTASKRAAIGQQLPESEKQSRANRTIDNSGAWPETERQIEILWSEVKILSQQKGDRAWPCSWPEALAVEEGNLLQNL